MAYLGKDPRLYSLRSIRQGSSTKATDMKMPEIFLKTSGGWKGNALERYRKDQLPKEQAVFSRALGRKLTTKTPDTSSEACHTGVLGRKTSLREPVRSIRVNVRRSNRVVTLPAVRFPNLQRGKPREEVCRLPCPNTMMSILPTRKRRAWLLSPEVTSKAVMGSLPGCGPGEAVGGGLTRREREVWGTN